MITLKEVLLIHKGVLPLRIFKQKAPLNFTIF